MNKAEFAISLKIPKVPNYLQPEDEKLGVISVGSVPDHTLQAIGDAWTRRLIERAAEVRAARNTPKSKI